MADWFKRSFLDVYLQVHGSAALSTDILIDDDISAELEWQGNPADVGYVTDFIEQGGELLLQAVQQGNTNAYVFEHASKRLGGFYC